jgi:hypothetical protein
MGGTSSTTGLAPNPWAQWGGLGMAALMMSDRDFKKNIQKIGETKDGQPIYRYQHRAIRSGGSD